jgi:hypothetical protein
VNLFREEAALKKQRKESSVQADCGVRQSAFFYGPEILWQGRNRVTVDGAEKIGFLSQERIVVLLKKESLSVCGKGLMCLSFRGKVLVIGGRIDSLSYGEETV